MVCQGVVTEPEYIKRLVQTVRMKDPCHRSEALDPVKLVERAAAVADDRNASRVYVVIDVDDSTQQQVEQAVSRCRRKSSGKRTFKLVVSNESIDCWLYAHVCDGPVPAGQSRSFFQDRLAAGGYLRGKPAKHLDSSFPVDRWQDAERRITVVGLNESGQNPSTGMPALIRELFELSGR